MKDYSQNKEQAVIVTYFGSKKGSFLDIGAHDGIDMSNTMCLIELGWTGVCLEPSMPVFESLQKNYKSFPVKLINKALSNKTGKILLYDAGGCGASTTEEKLKNQWVSGGCCKFTEVHTPCISSEDLLKEVGKFHNFVNIDTEWTSQENLFNLISAGLKFNLLCVEHDDKPDEIVSNLPIGIREHYRNNVNVIIEDGR